MSLQHIISTKHFPALAYRRYGAGPAIMLIHGFPASGSLWDEVASYLSESLTVLVPDVPGSGDSRLGGAAVSMEELATIIPAIFDDAGIAQGVVAGHSMGGYIALAAAELFGSRFNGLTFVHSTALADDGEKKEKRRKAIELIRKGGREQFIRGMIPGLFSEPFKNGHPEIIQERIEDGLKLSPDSLIAFYNAMIDRPERLEVLRSAHFPVQWILGKEDATIPWQTCLQQSTLPRVSFVRLYDECGHMSMIEQKRIIAERLTYVCGILSPKSSGVTMTMKQLRLTCLLILFVAGGFCTAHATHIVGGEVSYVYLGSNNYRVRIDIYQDCISGDPQAIAQDNPAIVSIFTGNGNLYLTDSILSSSDLRVPDNFSNDCVNNKPKTCLNRVTFIKIFNLPPNSNGYEIVYQRCCRNGSILNITDPGAVGASYYAMIPPSVNPDVIRYNNSAVFKNYPPQIICINNPIFYDHSATDVDGDSLSYEFCTAYTGGSATNAKPKPLSTAFEPVKYQDPYSAKMPMRGNPPLQVDAKTGLITGTPNQLGRYVVTVCCHEWRNGVMINTVTREFQFVVTNCSKAVVANIPQYSEEFNTYIVQCKGYTVRFTNLSTGANVSKGDAYTWDFGVGSTGSDTSHLKEPEYTYPDTGVYTVKLIVNRGSTCTDSITRLVKIYPDFRADFEHTGFPCPNAPIQFVNTSVSTYMPITYYGWDFGDGHFSDQENPEHIYGGGGVYPVILRAKNVKGCTDTARKDISVEDFRPFAGNDTIIVKGESIIFNAKGGSVYTWTPPTYLNNAHTPNPIGYYPDTMRMTYAVHISSEGGCEGDDSITVWVVGQSAIFVPTAFSPNGDGRNDLLRPIGIGYRNINFFRIYNRWGQPVFYGTRFNDGWDGSYQGHTADIGTYFWVLSITDRFGNEQQIKGDSALVR